MSDGDMKEGIIDFDKMAELLDEMKGETEAYITEAKKKKSDNTVAVAIKADLRELHRKNLWINIYQFLLGMPEELRPVNRSGFRYLLARLSQQMVAIGFKEAQAMESYMYSIMVVTLAEANDLLMTGGMLPFTKEDLTEDGKPYFG